MPTYNKVIPLPPNVTEISILQYYRVVRADIRIKKIIIKPYTLKCTFQYFNCGRKHLLKYMSPEGLNL
jgi:hypothetical protein